MGLTDPPDRLPVTDPLDTIIRCESYVLDRVSAERPELVDTTGVMLLNRIKRWAMHNGYTLAGHRTYSIPSLPTESVMMTVEGFLRPRTDGEWPSLHQAIREDRADLERLRAAESRGGPRAVLDDRDPF